MFFALRRRANIAAAAAPKSRTIGGAGTSVPLELLVLPVLPDEPLDVDELDEDEDELLEDEEDDDEDDDPVEVVLPPKLDDVLTSPDDVELVELVLLPEDVELPDDDTSPLDVELLTLPEDVLTLPDDVVLELVTPPVEVETPPVEVLTPLEVLTPPDVEDVLEPPVEVLDPPDPPEEVLVEPVDEITTVPLLPPPPPPLLPPPKKPPPKPPPPPPPMKPPPTATGIPPPPKSIAPIDCGGAYGMGGIGAPWLATVTTLGAQAVVVVVRVTLRTRLILRTGARYATFRALTFFLA